MQNRHEDMHHAAARENLDLASGSLLSLALNQPELKLSKIQKQCNSAA